MRLALFIHSKTKDQGPGELGNNTERFNPIRPRWKAPHDNAMSLSKVDDPPLREKRTHRQMQYDLP
jgi:hypothetical protein